MTTRLRDRLNTGLGSSSVQVISSGRIEFNEEMAAKIVGDAARGEIQRNAAAGRTPSGGAMKGYSTAYEKALRAGGEDTNVDLTLTGGKGGMLGDLKWRHARGTGLVSHVVIFMGTGRSPQVVLRDGRAKRTGKLGPVHAELATWIHKGTGRMPARPFFELPRASGPRIARLLMKANLFRVAVSTTG